MFVFILLTIVCGFMACKSESNLAKMKKEKEGEDPEAK
jgi:hypothetical protein